MPGNDLVKGFVAMVDLLDQFLRAQGGRKGCESFEIGEKDADHFVLPGFRFPMDLQFLGGFFGKDVQKEIFRPVLFRLNDLFRSLDEFIPLEQYEAQRR